MIDRKLVSRALAIALALGTLLLPAALASADAAVPVETFTLDNGMKFLLVQKPEMTTVNAGWVAHVGSANEYAGITGISHLFEHMMFKGTRPSARPTPSADQTRLIEEQDSASRVRSVRSTSSRRIRYPPSGEIEDPLRRRTRGAPEAHRASRSQVRRCSSSSSALIMVKDEFDKIYTGRRAPRA